MDFSKWILLCCLIVEMFPRIYSQGKPSDDRDTYIEEAIQIFNTIFHKYNSKVPPRKNFPQPVMLEVYVNLVHVVNLDVINQLFESTIDVQLKWTDGRLSWYPQNVKEITLARTEIWSPDLSITNAIYTPEEVHSPKVVVMSTGQIFWYRRLKVKTFCHTNITTTSQVCEVTIGSNLLGDNLLDFDLGNSRLQVGTFPNHEWEILNSAIETRSIPSARKANTTYSEFVCKFTVHATGCCDNYEGTSQGRTDSMTSSSVIIAISGLLVIFQACFAKIFAQY